MKTLPRLAVRCTVHYLFIYLFGLGANVCLVALDISDRKDQRPTPQMKLSKSPDSWVPRRTSLACTFYYGRCATSQLEGKRDGGKKKRQPSSHQTERKKKRQSVHRCIITVHDGMNYECVEGIRKQWLKSLGSLPSFLTLSLATNYHFQHQCMISLMWFCLCNVHAYVQAYIQTYSHSEIAVLLHKANEHALFIVELIQLVINQMGL